MPVRFVPCLLPLILFQSGLARADIVGGEEVKFNDPIRASTAALYSPSPGGRGGALCTASLIGKNIAVTAAHCITPGTDPVLIFGRDVHAPLTEKRPVTGTVVNSKWKTHAGRGMDEGDIALVRFRGGIPEGYSPVPMSRSEDEVRKGSVATLAGYGISNARAKSGAGVLRKTRVGVANPRRGKSEMILDQSRGHGACHGDSGGPAFMREGGRTVLAGVTNRSYPTRAPDDCGHQVVYTKVSAYRDWIAKGERKLDEGRGSAGELAYHSRRGSRHLLKAKTRAPEKIVRRKKDRARKKNAARKRRHG